MHVSGAAAEVAAAGTGGRHVNGGQHATEYSAVNFDDQDHNHENGGQQIAAHSPVKPGDEGAARGSTTEHAVIGFAFNALSTIFVMLMATCAKLAGDYSQLTDLQRVSLPRLHALLVCCRHQSTYVQIMMYGMARQLQHDMTSSTSWRLQVSMVCRSSRSCWPAARRCCWSPLSP